MTALREQPLFWRSLAAILIVATAGAHLQFLADQCPLGLAPDEAHYWHWSQHLDASYYSKGPLVAWLIRGSCTLFGNTVLGVRAPAVLCMSLFLASLYVLSLLTYRREPLALLTVVAALTIPPLSIGRSLMTIDAPYVCCWGWALVLGHLAILHRRRWAWPALGLVIGLGILAKYTMVLWLASATLFLLFSKEHRPLLRHWGFWCMGAIAGLCCLPILAWNISHDWIALRHVGGQAGVTTARSLIRWAGPIQFLVGQMGLLFGFWFVAWVAAMIVNRRHPEAAVRYLWWLSLPTFALFGLFSFRTEILLNWPITAYVSGLVLAGPWLLDTLRTQRWFPRTAWRTGLFFATAFGILAIMVMHRADAVRPAMAALAGPASEANPLPLRRLDPTCRLRGWHQLARQVDVVADQVRVGGQEPVLAASRWTIASELAFYGQGHPMVHSVGSALWDRQSQFDLWRPNPIRDPDEFRGRTFVFVDVGGVPDEIRKAFEVIEPTTTVRYEEDGQLIAFWDITVCRCFRGFSRAANRQY